MDLLLIQFYYAPSVCTYLINTETAHFIGFTDI